MWDDFDKERPDGTATKQDFYKKREEIDRIFAQKCFLPKKEK